ncbi:hypothetical protein IGS68_04785 [Skermanella sp. TT6]|uniref:HIRAN domain-containing protein n=1 Tax=Skermanella cutis TaxID=2775420 RepID=A0ABX7B854_9PROT|nr:HIRAN domain-containing protein [Skermanella sp. TT6]QQP90565.1 hypothetical protein IGS68_04785 [Skermanella sp. TT6]
MENWVRIVSEPQRLYLAWQAPDHLGDRFRWAVGELRPRGDDFLFRYFQDDAEFAALNQHRSRNQDRSFNHLISLGYKGYPAFGLKPRHYETGVRDAFVSRMPPRNRPDFSEYMRQFRLAPELPLSDFALLGLTEAKLPSDGFSFVDPLNPDADQCDLLLEIAGYRYYHQNITASVGSSVELLPEPDNQFDPHAVKISSKGITMGYINGLQASTFLRWFQERRVSGVIERLNGRTGRPRAFIFVRIRPKQAFAAA